MNCQASNPLLEKAEPSKMTREALPIRAAERRQIVATGVSPWVFGHVTMSPRGATDFSRIFRPSRGLVLNDTFPQADARGYDLSPLCA